MIRAMSFLVVAVMGCTHVGQIDLQQEQFIAKYSKQDNCPKPETMRVNRDREPDLTRGFTSLFNGKNLDGWTMNGGAMKFEARDGVIVGTCVSKTDSAYLCTDRKDFADFVFTCEMKWLTPGNSGIMYRSQTRKSTKKDKKKIKGNGITVFGPQAEMEGPKGKKGRNWSGGIYGQSCGGWFYPLWLKAHKEARMAGKSEGWSRLTIKAEGKVIKTWVNGTPAAHWITETYLQGLFGLQIHSGNDTVVQWRNIRVKSLGK